MSSSTTSILSAKARAATSAILRGIDGSNISTALQPYFPTLRSLLFGAAPPFLGGASLYALFQRYKQDQFKIEQLAWYVSYIVQQSEGFAEIMDTPALVIEALESVMDNAIENNEVSEREGERALKTLRKRVWSEHEEEIQGDKVMGQKPQDRIVRPVKRKRLNNGRVGEIVSTSPETGYQRREYEVQSGLGLKKMKNTRTRKEKVQIVHKSNDNNSMLQVRCDQHLGASIPTPPRRNPPRGVLRPQRIGLSDDLDSGVGLYAGESHNANQEDESSWGSDI